ncbi:MAG: GNAT family N-acetyltransferase [Acidimicrobiales bacterium]
MADAQEDSEQRTGRRFALTNASQMVRPAEAPDVPVLSSCLARAFEDDPVSRYLFPAEHSHLRRLERYFRWQFKHVFIPRGEAWTTEDLVGASLWIPPRRRPPPAFEAMGQLVSIIGILGRQTSRALRLLEELETVHPNTTHCYLGTIGTDPDRQRSGVGSSLMRVVLDRLDRTGMPAYLESSKEENLSFYRRHGFEVTGEIGSVPGGIPRIWLMWRDPRSPGGRPSHPAGTTRSALTPPVPGQDGRE